jgi:hypothetical protein
MITRCRICKRILNSTESVDREIGPTCYSRLHPVTKCTQPSVSVSISEHDEARQYKLFEEVKVSADHRIENVSRVKSIVIRCYECGKPVDVNNPMQGHDCCLRDEDILRFDIDWEYKK